MQSIFTFDHDPPRVSSPWRAASEGPKASREVSSSRLSDLDALIDDIDDIGLDSSEKLTIEKLHAEPQEGPTEYKVHLLLRPRRTHFVTNNTKYAAGSQHSKSRSVTPHLIQESFSGGASPLSRSNATRQHRLEQLTTQLLWRLQQSSPFHAASPDNMILPSFPETNGERLELRNPAKLLPGLEESNGALYEIGVSDDGTFVGLTREEMHESLSNLQAMAACLGCATEVLRMVKVGEAECVQDLEKATLEVPSKRMETLWVSEAYIKPLLQNPQPTVTQRNTSPPDKIASLGASQALRRTPSDNNLPTAQEQIRVTLAGATMSGKSSLLGTLSTSTLDNGRGSSRLSLLKHRHEIKSGMTSSVTQELVGYEDISGDHSPDVRTKEVNYSTDNVSSWTDIHARSCTGRLALMSDSAGHPRYRRTTVRGLLGCAPHWTMLCLPASNSHDVSIGGLSAPRDEGQDLFIGASAHISMAQLDLCLRLRLPLVVLITKLDAASKEAFRQILSALLSCLKAAGRKPIILANDNATLSDVDHAHITPKDIVDVQNVVTMIDDEGDIIVPIVFTSAVKGIGIGKVHALLRHLPVRQLGIRQSLSQDPDPSRASVFHIDDVFKLSQSRAPSASLHPDDSEEGSIVSGLLAHGEVRVGQELLLGPFSAPIDRLQDESEDVPPSNPEDPFLAPRSFSDALARVTAPPVRVGTSNSEWRRVRVVSIRNLRLPAQALSSDRVGTIGVVPIDSGSNMKHIPIRRGMILADKLLEAAHTLTASFDISDASSLVVGNRVVVYTASVRSSAKVVAVALRSRGEDETFQQVWQKEATSEEAAFAMDEEESINTAVSEPSIDKILVTLQLDSYREWIEVGAKLLVMPGGGPGIHSGDRGMKGMAGLEGFVGSVVETFG